MTLLVLLFIVAAAQNPPAPTASMTGLVADEAGAPMPRAIVLLRDSRRGATIRAVADQQGRFQFTVLEPGRYLVRATAGEFRATHIQEGDAMGKPVQVKAGDSPHVAITLKRALAISGRVVDEAGLPLAGVGIMVRSARGMGLVSYRPRRTDDLGNFRVFGLSPGSYSVCADAGLSPVFDRSAQPDAARFVDTCYASGEGHALVILAEADAEGVEIRMRRARTSTISGTVLDASGAPAQGYTLSIDHIFENGSRGTSRGIQTGDFRVSNLPPGRYAVSASIGVSGMRPADSREVEIGHADVTLEGADVEGLVLTMKKGATLRGILTFEDTPPPDLRLDRLRIGVRRVDNSWSGGGANRTQPVEPNADSGFELKDLFGPYVLDVSGFPATVEVKAVRYRGADILGIPTEFDGDPRHPVEIVLTTRLAELSGRVLDERGNVAPGARVFLVSADRARWFGRDGSSAIASKDGTFSLRGLVAGDYLVVGLSRDDYAAVMGAGSKHRATFDRLAAVAERITILDNDRRVMDVNMRPLPGEPK